MPEAKGAWLHLCQPRPAPCTCAVAPISTVFAHSRACVVLRLCCLPGAQWRLQARQLPAAPGQCRMRPSPVCGVGVAKGWARCFLPCTLVHQSGLARAACVQGPVACSTLSRLAQPSGHCGVGLGTPTPGHSWWQAHQGAAIATLLARWRVWGRKAGVAPKWVGACANHSDCVDHQRDPIGWLGRAHPDWVNWHSQESLAKHTDCPQFALAPRSRKRQSVVFARHEIEIFFFIIKKDPNPSWDVQVVHQKTPLLLASGKIILVYSSKYRLEVVALGASRWN